jgi:ADP-ribosylglycohydrolase
MVEKLSRRERFRGVILGTAVGDALGLPAEGISRRRSKKLFKGRWRHRLVFNRGMISDDTEHTVFAAQSLLAHPESCELFTRRLSWCFRWWLLSLPAGIGLATLRSIVRLWGGISPSRSGVRSAGNGPAMRSAPVGAFFASDPNQLDDYLQASTIITHTDPRALTGAKAVAYLTSLSGGLLECSAVRQQPRRRMEEFGGSNLHLLWTAPFGR